MPQTINVEGLGPQTFPDDATQEDIAEALNSHADKVGPQTSALGAAGRAAAMGVGPGAAFVAGFGPGAKGGAAIGALVPGAGETGISEAIGAGIGGLITGTAAAWAANKAQHALLKAAAPDFTQNLDELQSADVQQHPVATIAGELASMGPSAKLAPFKLATLPFRAALGAGVGAVQPMVTQGRMPTGMDIGAGAAAGALFGEGRFGKTTLIPRAKAAAEGATGAQPTPELALHPEVQTLLDEVLNRTDHQVEVVKPDASWKPRQIARPNRETGKIELNAAELNGHIMEDTSPEKRAEAMNTILAHEDIHLRTAPEDAERYTGTLTALEKGIERKLYGDPKISDTNLGFEAIRRRMEQLSKLDTSETVSLVGKERWKLKSLEALNSTVRGIRESMGTKASKEGLAILDRVTGNIEAGIIALGGTVPEPAMQRKQPEDIAEPGDTSHIEVDRMSNSEAGKFFDDNLKRGNPAQKDGVIAGMKMAPDDVPRLKALSEESGKRMGDAIRLGDNDAFKAAFGKHVWYNAAIEGANREGPNFDTLQKSRAPGPVPTADELLKMTPEDYGKWQKDTKYGFNRSVEIAARMSDADFPKLEAERDSLRAEAAKLNAANARTPADFAKRAQLLSKAQTLNEIVEANQMLKGQHAGEDQPAMMRPKKITDKELLESDPANPISISPLTPGQKDWLSENAGRILRDFTDDSGANIRINVKPSGIWAIVTKPERPGSPSHLSGTAYTTHTGLGDTINGNYNNKSFHQDQRDLAITAARELEQIYQQGIPDAKEQSFPGMRRQKKDEKQADLSLGAGGQPAASATELGAKALVTPRYLTADKIDHEAKGGTAGLRTITDAEVKSPSALAKIFGVRTGSKDENATKTRTVAVLRDNYTGKIEAVSTYPDAKRGIKMGDPSLLSDNAARPHRQMTDLLHRYTPLYAIRLKDAIQNFHERFGSMQEFQEQFGTPAKEGMAQATGAAPGQSTAAAAPGEIGQIEPPQDAEAGAVHEFFKGTTTPEGMRTALTKGPYTRQMISALRQMMEHEQAKNPQLTAAEAIESTLANVYEDLNQTKNRSAFTKRFLGRFAEPIARTNEPVGPATAQEPPVTGQAVPPQTASAEVAPTKAEPAMMRNLKQNLADEAAEATAAFTAIVQRHDVATEVARGIDSVENTSNNLSHQAEMDVRLRSIQKPKGVLAQKLTGWTRGNREILSAANVLIESSFDKSKLPDYQKLLDDAKAIGEREVAIGRWMERRRGQARLREVKNLQDSLTYAEAHWDDPDLQKTAQRAAVNYQEIYQREKLAGYDLTKDPNYLPHRYVSGFRIGQKTYVMGKRFREPKTFDSLFEAIANPDDLYISATHDAASLVGHRTRQSLNMINKDAWLESLKAMDLPNGQKLALAPKMGAHGLVSPDANYRLVEVRPGKTLAIHQEFADGIQNLTAPDWIEGWGPTRGLLHAEQMLKHSLLIGDFFHLMRMGYYGASILGRKLGWQGGWTVLDIQSKNIPEAIKRGIITEKDAQWGRELVPYGNQQVSRRWLVEKFYKEMGSNLGKVQDALYKDLITDMTAASPNWRRGLARVADPTVGRYNRFLFDKLTRGLMAESVAREFEKQSKAKPDANPEALMKDIARDVNNFYGNIGRQGWFKSAGMRSFMRLFMLAPQWVEGLTKKEAIGYSRLTGASSLMGKRQGLTALGTTGSAVGKGMLFMAGLTQAINLITRGHPTWMNEEKEHKLDAWIPAWGSNKEGFWLSPLALFNEITHDLWRLGWSKGTLAEAAAQIAGNKESPLLRAAIIMGTGKTPQGEQTTSSMERIGEAGKALIPTPITFGRLGQFAGNQIAPGLVPPTPAGQAGRSLAGVFGLKIEQGLTQTTKMSHLAKDFMQKEGLTKDSGWQEIQNTSPSYSKLRQAIRNDDTSKAKRILDGLRKSHTDAEILKALKSESKRPFTGSLKNEKRFLGSLDEKQLDAYFKATDEKLAGYERFVDWYLRQPPTP
jgi:hypothetical protein